MAKIRIKPTVVNVRTVKFIKNDRAIGFIGAVPLPRPKGRPFTIQIKVPALK